MTMNWTQGQLSRGRKGDGSWLHALASAAAPLRLALALALMAGLGLSAGARADEAYAKQLKAMSDYMAQQSALSFRFVTDLEIVTPDHQKLTLANSGTVNLSRPDKIRAKSDGGFSSVGMIFDGKILTLVHKNTNTYAQADVPGTLDHLIDELQEKFDKPALVPIC
jgi:hypothetical protein